MAKHAVVRTDNMSGTDVRTDLVSVKYMGAGGETPTVIDNGNIVKLDKLVVGEREVFVGKDLTGKEKLSEIVLIASPEVMYDEHKRNLDEFENEAGKICRGYRFRSGSMFAVTKEAFAADPQEKTQVVLAAGTKMKADDENAGSDTVLGKIIAKEQAGRYLYYVIEVA